MTAKRFGGWVGLALLAVAAAAALVAAAALLLLPPGAAGAQAAECRDAGVVPGSITVVSSNNRAGEASGHTIRFQLCPSGESTAAASGNDRPVEIGLLWNDWFYLDHPEQAGITLTETGGGKSWNAATAFARRACHSRIEGTGVSVGFAGDELDALVPPGKNAPVDLQFDVPESAGILNPIIADNYWWRIVLRYDRGGYLGIYTESVAPPIVAPSFFKEAGISISRDFGSPGSIVTVAGYGFPPLSPVESVQVGGVDVTPDNPASTDDQGQFRLDIPIPGLDSGRYTIQVVVADIPAVTGFRVPVPRPGAYTRSKESLRNLGDNLVRAFLFDPGLESWTFYDPEIPEVSTLTYLIPGCSYWILVKEPVEVILNRQTRDLTCRPDGDCWNIIVW